jgi:hypothetical protein
LSPYTTAWVTAFAITITVEIAVATPLLAPKGAGRFRRAGIVALANLATHPLVWFAFPQLGLFGNERLAVSELFAVAVETAAYILFWPATAAARAWSKAVVLRSFGTSAVANGASFAVGLTLRALGLPI